MSDAAPEHDIPFPRRSWLRRRWWLVTGVLLALIVLALYLVARQAPALPHPSEVASIRAKLLQYRLEGSGPPRMEELKREHLEFVVPPDHVAPVLAAFEPASRDWLPAGWQVMADLDIRLNDGRTVRIELYYTFKGRGAFSVHPDYPRTPRDAGWLSHYFRGGTDERLHNALMDAYRASQQK